jgi:TPR repeat protein
MESSDYGPIEAQEAFIRGDYDLVLRLTMPHAIKGNSDAQTELSLLYQCGLGVDRDVLEAERWLLKAAEQNNPVAWNNLGTLYASQFTEMRHRWNDACKCYQKAKELGLNVADPYPPPPCAEPD